MTVVGRFGLAMAMLAAAVPAAADNRTWLSRADASELRFTAYYEGEALPGQFKDFRVTLRTDDASGEPVALEVDVDTASADMNDREINQELAEPGWFDVRSFTSARFESESIAAADGAYLANGRLRLKGIEHTLTLRFTFDTALPQAGIEGSARLSRLDWNIGVGEWSNDASLSNRVDLSWRVSLAEAR